MTGKNSMTPVPEGPATALGYLAAVLLLPWLVLWSQDNALFTGYGYIDPWIYFGYFRNLLEFKRNLFIGNPHGAHLSWILPGAALHSLFAPVAATRLLHLGVHTLATCSLFLTLKWAAGTRRAFIGAMLFSANPWLWAATGWDYVDGIGIAYCLLTMAILTWAALKPGRRWALLAAGIALAALLSTGAGWLTLAPLLPLYYAGLMRSWHQTPMLRSFLALFRWFGAGCVLAAMVFSAINYGLDHKFLDASPISELLHWDNSRARWFWLALTAAAIAVVALFLARRKLPGSISMRALFPLPIVCALAWIAFALIWHGNSAPGFWRRGVWRDGAPSPWLWFPMLAAATAVVDLCREMRGRGRGISTRVLFSLLLLCALAWMTYAQARGRPELGEFYYAGKLLPFSFLVIGARFWPEVEKVRLRDYLVFCCALGMALGYAWLGEGIGLAAGLPYGPWLGAAALLAALFWVQFPEYLLCSIGGFFVFTALGVGARYGGLEAHAFRDQLQLLSTARARIETVRQGRMVRFWYDDNDGARPAAVALTSTYLGDDSLLSRSYAAPPCNTDLPPSAVVAAISTNPSHGPDFVSARLFGCWRGNGLRAVPVEIDRFGHGSSSYQMSLLRVETVPGAWQAMVPRFDRDSRVILLEAAASGESPEFPNKYWAVGPGEDIGGELRASSDGVAVRSLAPPNSLVALYPAMSAPVAGRYRFALRYWPRAGNFRFGVYVRDRPDPWLALSSKDGWNGSDFEMACKVDLAAGQEFHLALGNNSDTARLTSLLIKGVTAVRIKSERGEAQAPAHR